MVIWEMTAGGAVVNYSSFLDRGFSENSFLNRCDDSRHDGSSEPMKVVTSDYFAPKESHPEVELASNCSSSNDGTVSLSIGSRDSKHSHRKQRKRQSSCNSAPDSPRVRKRLRHPKIGSFLFRASLEEQASQLPATETASVAHEPPESVYEDLNDGDLGCER